MSTASIGAHSRPDESRWSVARKTLAAAGTRAANAAAATQARAWSLRQAVLGIGGLGCIDGFAFEVNAKAGLLVTGVLLLLLGWVIDDDAEDED